MGNDNLRWYFLYFVVCAALIPVCLGDVIVFSSYTTRAQIQDDGTLHIVKEMTLKNVGPSPVIPGELHFRMYEKDDEDEKASAITGYTAKGHYDNDLAIRKYDQTSQTELVIDIWEPILPGFIYRFKIEYDVDFKPKGILFYDISLPEEKTTIPIQNQLYELSIPKNRHVTYTMGGTVSDNKVVWENVDAPQVEYSLLPLPRLPLRGVNVFWFTLIVVLCIGLVFRIMKTRAR